jgi:hypothetical protein
VRKFGLIALVTIAAVLAVGFRSEGIAGAVSPNFLGAPLTEMWSGLIVQIKKNKNKHNGEGEHACMPPRLCRPR